MNFSQLDESYNFDNLEGIIGERDTYRGNTIENRRCLFIGERA